MSGNSTVYSTAIAQSTTSYDLNNQPYDFTIQLPFVLNNGSITLQVIVTDADQRQPISAEQSRSVIIVSVASDYNGDSYSDAALYSPNTSSNQGSWLVQTTSQVPATPVPPAFWLTSGTTFGPAANVVPFQGDFNGDGLTDLAYYNLSTATWYMDESKGWSLPSRLATPRTPMFRSVGYFDFNSNLPEEAAIYTIVNGQGTWSINTGNAGVRTVAFGSAGDIPVPGDYTGVGYDEVAVYRPSTGQFFVLIPTPGGAEDRDRHRFPRALRI